ncbi:MAG: hypothetical protein VX836_00005 [Pseudomonadota bacterium]|nr:hypothetical protein [Pseudomonadota bacterium]
MFRDTSAQDRVVERASFWKRRRLPITIALLIVIGIVMLAPGLARLWSAEKSVSASRLSIATVERGRFVRDIAAEGRVVAAVSPTLYAAAAGTVSFEITAGHDVAQGEVLGTIESPELESELAQEQSALQAMTVDYQRAQLDARQKALVAEETLEKARIDRNAAATEQRLKISLDLRETHADGPLLRNPHHR